MFAVVSAVVLRLCAKRMVCPAVVSLNTTAVSAVTGALKVAPSLWLRVSVLSEVVWPKAPVTLTAPVEPAFKVNDWVLARVPLSAPLMFKAPPAVLSVTSSCNTSAVLLSPKVMTAWVVATVPPMLRLLGAVTTKPPSKAKLSVAASPKVKVPVFKNVVAAVTCVFEPTNAR